MPGTRRHWGWHAIEPRWARTLVADADVPERATVVDIGAGQGAVTAELVGARRRVIAVEAHPGRARALRARFGGAIVVVQVDAAELRLPRHPFHVVANPPFHLTAAIFKRVLQPGSRLASAHLVTDVRAARWWTSTDAPGFRRWSRYFVVERGRRVPRRAFTPPPRVDACVLVVRRR